MDWKKKLKGLPDACGVYVMKSKEGETLYVGKAASIRKRVQSHFRRDGTQRISLFIERVADIDYILSDTEEQALLLEATLIKERKPKYNVAFKDDKSYPYVAITEEPYPRIHIKRLKNLVTGVRLFGPFTNVKLLRKALKLIRQIFPYCSCKQPRKSCLYYHLNLCPGPGITAITEAQYRENIGNVGRILSGERKELVGKLQKRMKEYAQEHNFEQAARIRDQLVAIYNLYAGKKQVNELLILKEILRLKKIPFTIEAIDISSLSGREAGGSVVVFQHGVPDKNNYRRYRIKEVEGIDDFQMIAEVTRRRYRRLLREGRALPDLVIVDGGYAHANVARKELDKLGLALPLIGIAKRNEEIYFPGRKKPLILAKDSPALHLIQRVRDEAHRFAHKYHSLLRKKDAFGES